MRTPIVVSVGLLVVGCLLGPTARAFTPYAITELDLQMPRAWGLNNSGQVAGCADLVLRPGNTFA